jgi:hypothetical protein
MFYCCYFILINLTKPRRFGSLYIPQQATTQPTIQNVVASLHNANVIERYAIAFLYYEVRQQTSDHCYFPTLVVT